VLRPAAKSKSKNPDGRKNTFETTNERNGKMMQISARVVLIRKKVVFIRGAQYRICVSAVQYSARKSINNSSRWPWSGSRSGGMASVRELFLES
jgi:hypothetical protein